jgi:two-component system, sensor histidine kinase and response regulator
MIGEKRILIVEDTATQALKLQQLLRGHGAQTSTAQSGQKALEILSADANWDLIISDIVMPGMDGFELCKAVKDLTETRHIPFFLLVSLLDRRDAVRAMTAGADNILLKDFDKAFFIPQLIDALKSISGSGAEQAKPGQIYFNENWCEVSTSPAQLAAMVASVFAIAIRQHGQVAHNSSRSDTSASAGSHAVTVAPLQ